MKEVFIVFLGGGAGSVLRYLGGKLASALALPSGGFPWPTMGINIIGCFLIGLFSALVARNVMSDELRLLLVVGLCGGFTTFSTFSNESLTLLKSGQTLSFALYVAASVIIGLLATWVGFKAGR